MRNLGRRLCGGKAQKGGRPLFCRRCFILLLYSFAFLSSHLVFFSSYGYFIDTAVSPPFRFAKANPPPLFIFHFLSHHAPQHCLFFLASPKTHSQIIGI